MKPATPATEATTHRSKAHTVGADARALLSKLDVEIILKRIESSGDRNETFYNRAVLYAAFIDASQEQQREAYDLGLARLAVRDLRESAQLHGEMAPTIPHLLLFECALLSALNHTVGQFLFRPPRIDQSLDSIVNAVIWVATELRDDGAHVQVQAQALRLLWVCTPAVATSAVMVNALSFMEVTLRENDITVQIFALRAVCALMRTARVRLTYHPEAFPILTRIVRRFSETSTRATFLGDLLPEAVDVEEWDRLVDELMARAASVKVFWHAVKRPDAGA
jgi:hypothetical protein